MLNAGTDTYLGKQYIHVHVNINNITPVKCMIFALFITGNLTLIPGVWGATHGGHPSPTDIHAPPSQAEKVTGELDPNIG